MTKKEIEQILKNGNTGEYSHLVIYCDHWDYTYGCKFIKTTDDIHEIIKDIKSGGSPGMFSIKEIYNYNLDINIQLNEKRAYHIEPLIIKKFKNKTKIEEALEYATLMHKGQYRKDGTEYITHPIKVAEYVKKFKISKNIETLIIAAYLHDVLEDTEATYYDLVERFGSQVASLVLELTTDEDLKKEIGKTKYLEIKMKNMSSWALVIKLCDRLANVSDLQNADEYFRNKYIEETIEILNYVTDNRNLSKTHLNIMIHIIKQLIILKQLFPNETNNNENTIFSINNKIKLLSNKINI